MLVVSANMLTTTWTAAGGLTAPTTGHIGRAAACRAIAAGGDQQQPAVQRHRLANGQQHWVQPKGGPLSCRGTIAGVFTGWLQPFQVTCR